LSSSDWMIGAWTWELLSALYWNAFNRMSGLDSRRSHSGRCGRLSHMLDSKWVTSSAFLIW
jgi:hypothetical protein